MLGVRFPPDSTRGGDGCELPVDFIDQGPDRIDSEAKRTRALRDGRVVEGAAREAEQVVAERDHGQEMPALILGDGRRRFAEDQVEAGPERGELAAQLMAQIREDGSDLGLIDQKRRDALALSARGKWGQADVHGLFVPGHLLCARAFEAALLRSFRRSAAGLPGGNEPDAGRAQETTIWLARRGCPSVRSSTAWCASCFAW